MDRQKFGNLKIQFVFKNPLPSLSAHAKFHHNRPSRSLNPSGNTQIEKDRYMDRLKYDN